MIYKKVAVIIGIVAILIIIASVLSLRSYLKSPTTNLTYSSTLLKTHAFPTNITSGCYNFSDFRLERFQGLTCNNFTLEPTDIVINIFSGNHTSFDLFHNNTYVTSFVSGANSKKLISYGGHNLTVSVYGIWAPQSEYDYSNWVYVDLNVS
jgi:hypothetical protein